MKILDLNVAFGYFPVEEVSIAGFVTLRPEICKTICVKLLHNIVMSVPETSFLEN